MTGDCSVRVRFHRPPERLSRYFTTFYLTEIDVPDHGTGEGVVTDHLHPEWANLRICKGAYPVAELVGQPAFCGFADIMTGPTSTTLRFTVGTTRIWGVGFLPLGWARFMAVPANLYADRVFAVEAEPFMARFRALVEGVFGDVADEAAELARITAFFETALDDHGNDDPRIMACHTALVDPDVASVSQMAEAARLPSHTVERLCRKHFGFPPRLLLRRQRFMRSLVQYMMDPSLHWIGAIDGHYHDQAQFVRDFRRFMGMSPSEYAASPKPVIEAVMRARHEFMGSAVQALHAPQTA